jgi:hypothetical protein
MEAWPGKVAAAPEEEVWKSVEQHAADANDDRDLNDHIATSRTTGGSHGDRLGDSWIAVRQLQLRLQLSVSI